MVLILSTLVLTGSFNSTLYVDAHETYFLLASSTASVPCAAPCKPDVLQVYTKKGIKIVDIAMKADGGVYSVFLPIDAYQIHIVGSGYSKVSLTYQVNQ